MEKRLSEKDGENRKGEEEMMRRKRFVMVVAAICCCLFFGGCLQVKERGAMGQSAVGTDAENEAERFSEYARVEAELAEQAQRISAFETRLAELEAGKGDAESGTNPPAAELSPTDPEALYRYTVSEDGYATVTSYLGTEETVVIPSSLGGCPVVAIGEEAFKNGSAMSVVIPSGVRRVDWFAFGGCYRLASVTVPDSVVAIGYGAFDLCASTLTFICSEGSYAAGYAKSYGIGVQAPK